MDYRLLLLFETYAGLKLEPADLTRLIARDDVGADPGEVLNLIHGVAARRHLAQADWVASGAEIWERAAGRGVRWSYLGQGDYPHAWYDLSCRPILFSYFGEPVWRDFPLLSVVGSRTPAPDTSRWLAREFSQVLAAERVGVVSGGARGVDQAAHRLALAAGRPTVAVLPSGLFDAYPPGSEPLWAEIVADGGCVLSTFPLDAAMRKQSFPIRNRWIAGLSPVTFVAKANHRSGSYLTAQLARDEERVVCTLPVSANAAQGLANLQLIADGHVMIRDAADLRILLAQKVLGRLGPGAAQGIQREAEEHHVDQPQADPGG